MTTVATASSAAAKSATPTIRSTPKPRPRKRAYVIPRNTASLLVSHQSTSLRAGFFCAIFCGPREDRRKMALCFKMRVRRRPAAFSLQGRSIASTTAGFSSDATLARHGRRHGSGLLAGDRRRPAPRAPGAAAVGGLRAGRAARTGRVADARRTRRRTAAAGAARFPASPGAGPVLPAVPPAAKAGEAFAPERHRRLRGRRAAAGTLSDGALHHRAGLVRRPAIGRRTGAAARQRAETGARLSPATEAGVARHRDDGARRAVFDRAGRLRPAPGLHAGTEERRRRGARFRPRILRQPRADTGAPQRVAGAPRPRRHHRLEPGAVRFARAA